MMAQVVNVLCDGMGIELLPENVMTHCEAALEDGYGPYSGDPETRWDLWYLQDYDGDLRSGGDIIRGKAIWFREQGKQKEESGKDVWSV